MREIHSLDICYSCLLLSSGSLNSNSGLSLSSQDLPEYELKGFHYTNLIVYTETETWDVTNYSESIQTIAHTMLLDTCICAAWEAWNTHQVGSSGDDSRAAHIWFWAGAPNIMWDSSWFFSVPPGKYQDTTFKLDHCHFIRHYFEFIIHRHRIIRYYIIFSQLCGVSIDEVWIAYWIYWPLVHNTQNYTLQITDTHRLVSSVYYSLQ
jgi:hypothetical protein